MNRKRQSSMQHPRQTGRRMFCRAIGAGGFSVALSSLLAAEQEKKVVTRPFGTAKNIIFLFMAGGPSQVEVLRSKVVGEERMAQQLPIGLSPVQRMILENIEREGTPRSQAALARRLGRTRATVHSAVKVLRRRGILHEDRIECMPHIDLDIYTRASTSVDYEYVDERR